MADSFGVSQLGFAKMVSRGSTPRYVSQPKPSELIEVGPPQGRQMPRNAKCFCGSGKKYKTCHGKL